jgi:hypothetical protein
VGPRIGLEAMVRRKIPTPYRDSNPPIIQPEAVHIYTYIHKMLLKNLKPRTAWDTQT